MESSSLVRVVSSASGGGGRSVSRFSIRRMGPPWRPPVSRGGRYSVDPEADDRLHPLCSLDHESEPMAGVVPPLTPACPALLVAVSLRPA